MEYQAKHEKDEKSANPKVRCAETHPGKTASAAFIPAILDVVANSAGLPVHARGSAIDVPMSSVAVINFDHRPSVGEISLPTHRP